MGLDLAFALPFTGLRVHWPASLDANNVIGHRGTLVVEVEGEEIPIDHVQFALLHLVEVRLRATQGPQTNTQRNREESDPAEHNRTREAWGGAGGRVDGWKRRTETHTQDT